MASQDWIDKDFYKMLGVAKDASEADIKKSYRKLARKYHPDQNPGDEAAEKKFKEISEAFSVLSNPEDRQEYDAIRAMGSGARFTAGAPGGAGGSAGFEDVFGGLFGQGGRRSGGFSTGGAGGYSSGGIPPEFADLFGGGGFGGGGFGGYQQYEPTPQKGADRVAETTISFGGAMRGTTIGLREPDGHVIDVRIPAGIKDGQKVRVKGKGSPGAAGSGDLMVTVHVAPHKFFVRDGDNIRIHVPVSFNEAALGGTIEVPTITGETVKVKVPAGSKSGRTLRLKGRGVKTAKTTGDMLVTLDVVVPQNLNEAAKKAVADFADATKGEDPRSGLMAQAKL
ncbi:DnaJ C-terminal domain-containing protein [Haematomicrobium sanguinis]|uniref:DnaJ C-terminal domain-containing protein n=1 Tax=Haematomicrobium sanguinis TaxID=479106 RepID=UPI00047AB2A3|nr:DnaJ C-terminal domain-containing protein [Haematomicrobium sanguinis]